MAEHARYNIYGAIMNLTEIYSYLFADSVITSLIFPLHSSLVYPVMLMFGGYNIPIIIAIAIAGLAVGAIGNFYLGKILLSVSRYDGNIRNENEYFKYIKSFSPYIMLASWIPFIGALLVALTGAAGARLLKILPIFMIVNAIYYSVLGVIIS